MPKVRSNGPRVADTDPLWACQGSPPRESGRDRPGGIGCLLQTTTCEASTRTLWRLRSRSAVREPHRVRFGARCGAGCRDRCRVGDVRPRPVGRSPAVATVHRPGGRNSAALSRGPCPRAAPHRVGRICHWRAGLRWESLELPRLRDRTYEAPEGGGVLFQLPGALRVQFRTRRRERSGVLAAPSKRPRTRR